MTKRKPKFDDQLNTQKAYMLLIEFIEKHQGEIEPVLWVGPMIAALAENFANSGLSYGIFKQEMSNCLEFYRHIFDKGENDLA